MNAFFYGFYQVVMIVSLLVVIWVIVLVWPRRNYSSAKAMMFLAAAIFVWTFGYFLEANSITLPQQLIFTNVSYIGSMSVPVIWLIFAIRYTGGEKVMSRIHILLLFIIPAAVVILVWTNQIHHFMWVNERLSTSGLFLITVKDYQPMFWVAVSWNYLLILTGSVILFSRLFMSAPLHRKQAISLIIALLLPLLWNILYVFDIPGLPRKDFTPAMFAFSGLAISIGVLRFHLFRLVPLAHSYVIKRMSDGVIVSDIDGNLLDINPAATTMTGIKEDAIGHAMTELERFCPVCSLLGNKNSEISEQSLVVNGEERWYEVETLPMPGVSQNSTNWLALLHDITLRKRGQKALENALEESQQHASETLSYLTGTRAVIEAGELREALEIIFQTCSTIVNASDGYFGFWQEGNNHFEVIVQKENGISREVTTTTMPLLSGGRVAIENKRPIYENNFSLNTGSGNTVPEFHSRIENVLYAPVIIDEVVVGMLVLANKPDGFNDNDVDYVTGLTGVATLAITHFRTRDEIRTALEKEKQLRASLEDEIHKRIDFTRALVHELKTPLTPIMATTEILLASIQDERWQRMIKNIQRGGDNLKQRIDDLLDVARGEIGLLSINPAPLSPVPLLHTIVKDMDYILSARHQNIELDIPEQLPDIMADEARLKQVVTHLLSNASKFSPDKAPIVLRVTADSKEMSIEISDKGIGIAEKALEKLFSPYDRTSADQERLSGLGLGLALSKNIIELHGGKIWVKSELGKGSTFGFSIPLECPATIDDIVEAQD